MPIFSVILPCYNVERFLPRAIESVLSQSYTDFELLVVIDGSPDNSCQIVESYAQKDHRIKVFEKENGGLSDARNYGLERATGQFIYFMDSDDWIEPDLLAENLKIIETENIDLVIFGYIQDDEDEQGNVLQSTSVAPQISRLTKGNENIALDEHHLGLMGYAWNKIYRKSFIDQYHLRFEKGISLVEDVLFNALIYRSSNVIRFNPKTYYHYINRPVVTLMKTFHYGSFELQKKKLTAIKLFLEEWNVQNQKEVLSFIQVQGIRYCIHNLFSYQNQLSTSEKLNFIRLMYNDADTVKLIEDYNPDFLNGKIYKFLIKYKGIRATYIMAKILK
ncbi:glycosyltransferase [Chryseobacterium sp. NEB161]|nr:glycosyltransferase [Chryseobacterium sp. NEB161]